MAVYDLIIAEKPSVARTIAQCVGASEKQDGFLEGNGYLVSWCIGHLVELAQPEAYSREWKKWSYEDLPIIPGIWKHVVKEETEEQFAVLKELMHREDVSSVICATDAGREGELIFRLVYEMTECIRPIRRLWISSMEDSAIRDGFAHLRPGSDYESLYQSALCRQKADWLVGINGTRLFTVLYGGKTLKVVRVQTPTLAMLADREAAIQGFKKEPYFIVHILCGDLEAVSGRIGDGKEAEDTAEACMGGQARVDSVEKEKKSTAPPKLYDLTTLQRDANRIFAFTAKQTLEYVQSLYEKRLVTYPRTDSQYLTDDMEQTAEAVVRAVCETGLAGGPITGEMNVKLLLNSKKVTDHHAIIPTLEILNTELAALPETERKILSLISCRVLCAVGEKHICETVKTVLSCNGYVFSASGKTVLKDGWKASEDAFRRTFRTAEEKEPDEKVLPDLAEGMIFEDVSASVSSHFTSPPKRFTEDSLLLAMERAGAEDMPEDAERKGLGTPATRAEIIEKLVRDGFVKREGKQLIPTEDGMKLIIVLPDTVKSPKLTADWENALSLIAKGEYDGNAFMAGIENMVRGLVQTYHSVSDSQKAMFGGGLGGQSEVLGKCPRCGGDVLKGRFGAYCRNKCGMNVARAMGTVLTDGQIKSMLAGERTLVKGLQGKNGSYDAFLIPEGIEDYTYIRDGERVEASRYKVKLEFLKKGRKEKKEGKNADAD